MKMKFTTAVVLGAFLLPSLAMAQIDTRATFAVSKTFADGNNVDEVVVSIDCNTGIILDQDKTLGDNDAVIFVVTDFTSGSLNCSIVEGEGTPGYSASYAGDGIDDGCVWEAIEDGGAFTCDITNSPDPVDIKVTKNWVLEGQDNAVDMYYHLDLDCSSGTIVVSDDRYGTGPASATYTYQVIPAFPSTSCDIDEYVYDSSIEVSNGCGSLVVSANKGTACTITNTVFFEGIPTLSQYGMAIMALLMLGVGFVGFRRFV